MTPALVIPVLGRKLYPGASVALDFTRNIGRTTAVVRSPISTLSGFTFARASTGYAETAAGALVAFASGVPRVVDRGLLVEESRTNLLLRSQEFDNGWSLTNITISADAASAPDGTTTADAIVEGTAVAGQHRLFRTATTTAAAYAFTCYVKAATRSWVWLRMSEVGTGLRHIWFNVSSGTVGTAEAGWTGAITAMGGGWYRVQGVMATALASSNTVVIGAASADNTLGMNGVDGNTSLYIWGAQLEAGAFATSYIPTTSASATRQADAPRLAGLSLAAPQTFIVVATVPPGVSTDARISLTDGSNTNRFVQTYNGTTVTTTHTGNNVSASSSTATKAAGSTLKDGVSFDGTTARFARDGGAATSGAGTAWSANLVQLEFGNANYSAGRYWNSYIQRALIYPTAFTDAQLAAATL